MSDPGPIRIAGAGPAGLAAAITLARGGRRVEVHEAKSDVGARFIGDLQILENSSEPEDVREFLARAGIATNFYFRPVTEARFWDHRLRPGEVRSATPYGFFIRRGPFEGSLDRGLLAQARELGVVVRFGSRLASEEADVVATGPSTPDGLAREITFVSDEEERVEVYFDHRLSPGGYSYLFILDGVGTFGCAIVSDFRRIDEYFEASLARALSLTPARVDREQRTGYSYMNFHLKRTSVAGTTSFTGEAAGFQDYLFGLGIRYALKSGWLAGRAILEERPFDELWTEELGQKQRTSLVNRFLYERGGNFGLSRFIRQAAAARDFNEYLASWHRDRWWKRLAEPLVRRLWRHEGTCRHEPGAHWCRARDTRMKVPPLGPADTR
ncbi:MAG TPA: NAD(P)-binding protein [Thermoanaerobaculia bacterium]|nr:NAD(P)-binding protein [Thermoanaerobaculia bacterium]